MARSRETAIVPRETSSTGQHIVKVAKNDDEIVVDHEWKELSNGIVKVSGTAHVTWDFDDKPVAWSTTSPGRASPTGARDGVRATALQKPLAGGVAEGIQVDGSRSWTGPKGKWDLTVQGVQMRWADPVPQAGSYRLASPKGRSLELSFARVDEDTIAVTLKNDTKAFTFNVNAVGAVDEQELIGRRGLVPFSPAMGGAKQHRPCALGPVSSRCAARCSCGGERAVRLPFRRRPRHRPLRREPAQGGGRREAPHRASRTPAACGCRIR